MMKSQLVLPVNARTFADQRLCFGGASRGDDDGDALLREFERGYLANSVGGASNQADRICHVASRTWVSRNTGVRRASAASASSGASALTEMRWRNIGPASGLGK